MTLCFLAGVFALSMASPAAHADDALTGITAVASKVSPDYKRAKASDGRFQPEYYSFGAGGNWGGEISDATIDKLTFLDVAHVIAAPLASQKYLPATDPNNTRLLIMVYWGTTAVPGPQSDSTAVDEFKAAQDNLDRFQTTSRESPLGNKIISQAPGSDAAIAQWSAALTVLNVENQDRARKDFANANMLGYDAPGLIGTDYGNHVRGGALGQERDDLVAEIEENRYFVVLMAYDFQLLWKQKKHKLLWQTRFSISERHNAFDKALPFMAQYAARYFGQDSHGLLRDSVPEGQVEIGEVKSLGEVAAPKK
jgi:hypothetical protein